MIYRVIGDIHARSNWQKLIDKTRDDIIYIFLGDFTDPYYYEGLRYANVLEQMKLIFDFWRENKEKVIILGSNHDLQYMLLCGETNRYDWAHAEKIHTIFEENKEAIYGAAYQIGEKYLITHAGVTLNWYQKWIDKKREDITLKEICNRINNLWETNKESFQFRPNATKLSDHYGDSSTHSPIWIRPLSLWQNNIFGFSTDKIQIIGHTRFEHYDEQFKSLEGCIVATGVEKTPLDEEDLSYNLDYWINDGVNKCKPVYNDNENPNIIQIDCLETETACLEIDGETLEWKKIKIEK